MWCNVGNALPKCEGDDYTQWTNCEGTLTFTDELKYVGEFKDGMMHGQGTLTSTGTDGEKYVGEWKDGMMHGQGTLTWGSGELAGNKYVGQFKNNLFHGKGTYTVAERNHTGNLMIKYTGDYVEDKKHGNAISCFAGGGIYVGEYKNDMRGGKGIMLQPGEFIIDGLFTSDTSYVGTLKFLADGRRFQIKVKDNVMIKNKQLPFKAKGIMSIEKKLEKKCD